MPDLHALLIGVDLYLPECLPGGLRYPNLEGSVRDVLAVEGFLKGVLKVPDERIVKLLSVNPVTGLTPPADAELPSYENMVNAFRGLTARANKGDQVLVHYSGHGGRATTKYPDRKGPGGLDEALVPYNIHRPRAQYLRDLEVAVLLDEMKKKGLYVTLVFDCCHSGGATRGVTNGVAVRGVNFEDKSEHDLPSLVAVPAGQTTRGMTGTGGLLPEPSGYTLLAACAPDELAREYAADGKERHGALTYWFLDAARGIGPGLTYRLVQDRLVSRIHSLFSEQTPMLEGEADREVFGVKTVVPAFTSIVMGVDPQAGTVNVGAGQAVGVLDGARFGIYPQGTADLSSPKGRKAVVVVTEQGAVESVAVLDPPGSVPASPITPGDPAVLIGAGQSVLIPKVRVVRFDESPPAEGDAALKAVAAAVAADTSGRLVLSADPPADFQVSTNAAGDTFQVLDRSNPITNLRPELKAADADAPTKIVDRLVHLSKFRAIQDLVNTDDTSSLKGKLFVEVIGFQENYKKGNPIAPKPFPKTDGQVRTLKVGSATWVRIRNDSDVKLNVTLIDLEPNWAISKAYPGKSSFAALDPGQELLGPVGLSLTASLPAGYDKGREVIKIFATKGPSNFEVLTLPPLDVPDTRPPEARGRGTVSRGGPDPNATPLGQFLKKFRDEAPTSRSMAETSGASDDWTVIQLEFQIVR